MHDGKMLYMLTQHSLYSRKFHPFLLCKCHRSDGVVNGDDHECMLLTQDEQCKYYEKSQSKWWDGNINQDDTYNQSDHMKWVDKHNLGVSHFGIPPTYLRRDNIRFDIFHMRSAITKRLMTYLRRFILSQTFEIISEFSSQVLSTF